MEKLFERAIGYFVMEFDVPSQGLLAGDQIYIDNDPQTTDRLVIAVWDDKAHICQRSPDGTLWDCCNDRIAPACAVVFGGALYIQRAIPGYIDKGTA